MHPAEEPPCWQWLFLQSGQPARRTHCRVSAFPCLSHFPNWCCLMLVKRMLPALATCGLPAKKPKIHPYICPRERAVGPGSESSVERHWAKAKIKPTFKHCWAHKRLSSIVATRRGQLGCCHQWWWTLFTHYCAPHPTASCIFAW